MVGCVLAAVDVTALTAFIAFLTSLIPNKEMVAEIPDQNLSSITA
jgi:hypothetical protein